VKSLLLVKNQTVETVAPLQLTAISEQIKWCWMKKIEGLFSFVLSKRLWC